MSRSKTNADLCTLLLLGLVGLLIVLTVLTVVPATAAPWHQQSINVESKVGTDRSIQSLDVMYPLSHSESSLLFADLRGRIDDNDSVEVNLGLAHRYVTSDPLGISDESVIGVYGFADRLESEFDNTFYQATAGFEYFTKDYSFRINGYLPEDEREKTFISYPVEATGTQIFFEKRQNYERPLPGYDVELGRTVRFEGWQLYGRGSYFRFHHSDVAEIEGSRFRAGLQFNGSHPEVFLPESSQLTLGVEWQEDNVREEQTFGLVRWSVPFGTQVSGVSGQVSAKNNSERSTVNSELRSWQQDRVTERISRDVDIVTGNNSEPAGARLRAVLAGTDRSVDTVAFAAAQASGNATAGDPGTLSKAIATAGDRGFVLVSDRNGALITDGETLTEGQVLAGALRLSSPDGEVSGVLTVSDGRPTVRGTDSTDTVIRTDDNLHRVSVRNLNVIGETTALAIGDDVDNGSVRNVHVQSGDVVVGDNVAGGSSEHAFTVSNLDVDGSMRFGNSAGAFDGTFAMSRVDVSESIYFGIHVGDNGTFKMSQVDVENSMNIGVNAGKDGTFKMNRMFFGGSVEIGGSAGIEGTFSIADSVIKGDLMSDRFTAYNGGDFILLRNQINGDLDIIKSPIRSGSLDPENCIGNEIKGDQLGYAAGVSCD